MKKWQKVLMAIFATVALGVTIGLSNPTAVDAEEMHRAHGVEGNPATALESRAWGLLAGRHGTSFRAHHYHRATNGALTHLNSSPWGSCNHTTMRTAWTRHNRALTASRLEGIAW
jgi:hypothetical protein